MDQEKWLEKVIDKMQADLTEMKADVKSLLEAKAESKGKEYALVAMISFAINILAIGAEIYIRR